MGSVEAQLPGSVWRSRTESTRLRRTRGARRDRDRSQRSRAARRAHPRRDADVGAWGRRFSAEGMEAVSKALGFSVEIRTPLRLRFDEEDKKIVELTSDQAWVLAFVLHRRRAARDRAGGESKTVLAVSVSKQLATAGHRTLLTCFNRRLGEHLRASVGGSGGIDTATFHQLCVQLAKEAVDLPPEEAGARFTVLRAPAPRGPRRGRGPARAPIRRHRGR